MPEESFQQSRLSFASESVLIQDPQGRYWARDPVHRSLEAQLLERFAAFELVVRVRGGADPASEGATQLSPEVNVIALAAYKGVGGFVRCLPSLVKDIVRAAARAQSVLVRLPGAIGSLLALACIIRGRPFAVQLVGDPDEVLRSSGFGRKERMTRLPMVLLTKWLCRRAGAVAYVTSRTLQQRYPGRVGAAKFSFSNVLLDPADLVDALPQSAAIVPPFRLCFCGTLSQQYKGLDVLLEALRISGERGLRTRLLVMGDGRHRQELEQQARNLGIDVAFLGQIDRAKVIDHYRASDLFVMPSRTEGLPRALIEAMAQGLPAIGTRVGGIPELLDEEVLVPSDDPAALASAIEHLLLNPDLCREQAGRNLAKAHLFTRVRIEEARREFVAAIPGDDQ